VFLIFYHYSSFLIVLLNYKDFIRDKRETAIKDPTMT